MMFPLVFFLIVCICVRVRTWSWLAGFKCHYAGESDTCALSASQGGSLSTKHLLSWGWTQEGGMEDRTLLPTGGWTAQASCLLSSSGLRCSWKGRVLWITELWEVCWILRTKLLDKVGDENSLFAISVLHSQNYSVAFPRVTQVG